LRFQPGGLYGTANQYQPPDLLNDSPKDGETFNSYTRWDYGWAIPNNPPPPYSPISSSYVDLSQYYAVSIFDQTGATVYTASVYPFLQSVIYTTGCNSNDYVCLQNACINANGNWNGNTFGCYAFWHLSSMCVKVYSLNAQRTSWHIDDHLGMSDFSGCVWTNAIPNLGSNAYLAGLQPLAYVRIPPSSINNRIDLTSVTLNVRFWTDPWVTAQYITQGSLAFGLTVKQKFITGLACTIVGVVWTAFLVCVAHQLVKRRGPQGSNYYQVDSTSTTYSGGGGGMAGAPVMGQPVYGASGGPGMYAPPASGGGGYPGGQQQAYQQY